MNSTRKHLDALERARIEANATLRDMHLADYAVDSLISEVWPKPWTYTTTSKAHVIEQQLAGNVESVKRKWSWSRLQFEYVLTIKV